MSTMDLSFASKQEATNWRRHGETGRLVTVLVTPALSEFLRR